MLGLLKGEHCELAGPTGRELVRQLGVEDMVEVGEAQHSESDRPFLATVPWIRRGQMQKEPEPLWRRWQRWLAGRGRAGPSMHRRRARARRRACQGAAQSSRPSRPRSEGTGGALQSSESAGTTRLPVTAQVEQRPLDRVHEGGGQLDHGFQPPPGSPGSAATARGRPLRWRSRSDGCWRPSLRPPRRTCPAPPTGAMAAASSRDRRRPAASDATPARRRRRSTPRGGRRRSGDRHPVEPSVAVRPAQRGPR